MKYKEIFGTLDFSNEIVDFLIQLWNNYVSIKHSSLQISSLLKLDTKPTSNKDLFLNENYQQIFRIVETGTHKQGESVDKLFISKNNSYAKNIINALEEISHVSHSFNYAIRSFVKKIIIAESKKLISSSSVKFLGVIILAPKLNWNKYFYIENIIHESSHIDLYIRQLIDKIVTKNKLLNSPLRKNKRPAILVFHSCFILSRIINFLILMQHNDISKELKDRILINLKLLSHNIATLASYNYFTQNGKLLFDTMEKNYYCIKDRIKEKITTI